jgi:TusA-related sulfurtransferase
MEVDARGLVCPQPVILTKKAMSKKPEVMDVLVDNVAALENVTRYATAMKYDVEKVASGDEYILKLRKK